MDRGMREVERQFAAGLAKVRANAPTLLMYPANLRSVEESPVHDLWQAAGELPWAQARTALIRLDAEYPDATTRSGLPLQPLIAWKILEAESDALGVPPRLEALGRAAVVTHPSLLTPELLRRAGDLLEARGQGREALAVWQQRWEREEQARALIRRVQETGEMGPPQWVEDGRGRWWVEKTPGNAGRKRVISAAALHELAAEVALQAANVWPSYAALQVNARGRSLLEPSGMALSRGGDGGFQLLGIVVDPEKLYAVPRSQSRWLAALLGCAFLAELAAFGLMRRALRREAKLGELKSNFVSSVSHELRAPIASLRLMAENLENGAVPESGQRQEYHRLMAEECRRLSALIDNVLDFARIEQQRRFYEFSETDIAALIRDAVQLLEPRAAQRQQTLVVELEPLDPPPLCDALAVRQALINLLDNATKFSPAGGTITVRLRPRCSASWELSVADEGRGIPREEHGRIFERFYRIGDELRRETQGAGIGLSLVQHIAQGHGGRVEVESQAGAGARFTLILPSVPPESVQPES